VVQGSAAGARENTGLVELESSFFFFSTSGHGLLF